MLNFIQKNSIDKKSFEAVYRCDECGEELSYTVTNSDIGLFDDKFDFIAEQIFDRDPIGFILYRKDEIEYQECCISPSQRIRYRPSETLKRFHESRNFFKGVRGPVGSGKSVACCMEIYRNMCEQVPYKGVRRTKIGIMRNTYGELKTTTIKTWLEWFGDITTMIYSSPIIGKVNISLSDGTKVESELTFVSQDRPKDVKRLLSLDLTMLWSNEGKEIPFHSILQAKKRVERFPGKAFGGATYPCVIVDTNSCDISCWYYEYSEKSKPFDHAFFDQPGALIRKSIGKGFEYLPNPKAENIENHNKGFDYYLRQVHGSVKEDIEVYILNWYGSPDAGNRVYGEYSTDNHTDIEFNPDLPIYWTNDFNYSPLSSAIMQIKGNNVYAVDEIIIHHADVIQAAVEFADRYQDHKKLPVYIYGDASGHQGSKHGQITNYIKIREYLQGHGFTVKMYVPRSNPGIRDGQNAVRAKVCDATGHRSFFVNSKKCRTIDEGYMSLKTKKGSTFLEDETIDSQHVLSAIRYMFHVLYPVKMKR